MAGCQQRAGCTRRAIGSTAMAVVLLAAAVARGTDYPLEASVLAVKDSGARQRLRLLTAPSSLVLPGGLPSLAGADVEVANPRTGERGTLAIPGGDGWSADASNTVYSYVGRFVGGVPAPVRVLRMK